MTSPVASCDGVLVVDKPSGMTSHDVVDFVRRLAGTRRVGHAGTLDPLATGVLPVVLGQATRLVRFLSGDPKEYVARARLGIETTTGDSAGDPLPGPSAWQPPSERDLALAIASFQGPQQQVPPMFSAKKVAGRRLYKIARAGLAVERKPVPIIIHAIALTAFDGTELELTVSCSPGTYVRAIITDLGQRLTTGATLVALRRTRSGSFAAEGAITLEALRQDSALARHLLPLDRVALAVPDAIVSSAEAALFCSGRLVDLAPPSAGDLVAVRVAGGRLLGVAERTRTSPVKWQPRVVLGPASGLVENPPSHAA